MPEQAGAVIAGLTLLAASRMDLQTMTVRRWVWITGGSLILVLTVAKMLAAAQEGELQGALASCLSLLLYFALQQVLFARMYGRADCHAFCLCAAGFWVMGCGFEIWVYQMATAYVLLAFIQAFRRNIARSGNLKCPVPFLPYITVSFVLWVDFIFWE